MSASAAFIVIVFMSLSFLTIKTEARTPVKKIKDTACYNQETGQESGSSNDCVLGDGGCLDNGCGDGQAEGPKVFIPSN